MIGDQAIPPSTTTTTAADFVRDATTQARSRRLAREIGFYGVLAVVPVAVGTGIGLLTRSRRIGFVAGGLTALGIVAARWQLQRLFTDEPDYEVEERRGKLEIRRYPAHVEARTTIDTTDFDAAREEGFRTLAGYIFGGNNDGEKLAMTAPVKLRRTGTSSVMSFVMPPGRAMQSLPRPSNGRVELAATGERRFAVMTFRRGYGAESFERMQSALRDAVQAEGLVTKGEPMFAGFDPPSTLPFLRRTEMWIELA